MIRWFCNWMKHTFEDRCITLYDQHPELLVYWYEDKGRNVD